MTNELGSGYAVDIESGRPIGSEPLTAVSKNARKINRIIERQQAFVNDLVGSGGEVIKEVVRLYAKRINEMAEQDPECRAYQSILSSVEIKINMGKHFSALKAEGVL